MKYLVRLFQFLLVWGVASLIFRILEILLGTVGTILAFVMTFIMGNRLAVQWIKEDKNEKESVDKDSGEE